MDITISSNYFLRKRDLRDQSCNSEEPERAREVSLSDSNASFDDTFTKVLNSPEYLHIFVNCMKNIGAKVKPD